MRSFSNVGLVVVLAIATAGACERGSARDGEQPGFDADAYVEEEFRDFFEVEEKAGTAHGMPEQALLPNLA